MRILKRWHIPQTRSPWARRSALDLRIPAGGGTISAATSPGFATPGTSCGRSRSLPHRRGGLAAGPVLFDSAQGTTSLAATFPDAFRSARRAVLPATRTTTLPDFPARGGAASGRANSSRPRLRSRRRGRPDPLSVGATCSRQWWIHPSGLPDGHGLSWAADAGNLPERAAASVHLGPASWSGHPTDYQAPTADASPFCSGMPSCPRTAACSCWHESAARIDQACLTLRDPAWTPTHR